MSKDEDYEDPEEESSEYDKEEELEAEAEAPAAKPIGRITHFFSKIGVAVIELSESLKVGEEIRIKGHDTDFTQKVDSMQVEHAGVKEAKAGESIGMKVKDRVREHDTVYRI